MRTRASKFARALTAALLSALLVAASSPASAGDTFRPVVRGRRGVVAGGHPLSVEAGMRILQRGGNAVDAGVATILAASVIEFSHFSFGGEVPILIKLRAKPVAVVEGMGTAPRKATREFFISHARADADREAGSAPDDARAQGGGPTASRAGSETSRATRGGAGSPNNPPPTQVIHIPSTGPTAATVPAVLDACVTALDEFGTKSLAEVMQPAIELADGFPVDELRVEYIRRLTPVFSKWADAKRVFLPGGEAPKVGDVFVQADLARTMRAIVEAEKRAARGGRHAALMAARDYFYKGEVGRRIGDYMQRNGGLLAAEDIAAFRARVGEPARGTYRGYEVYKAGFWTQGPAFIETLNILEGYDLKSFGHNSPEYVHALAEALKLGFADRDRYFGDPDFVRIPTAQLLSKDYAALRRRLIREDRASLDYTPGDPAAMKPLLAGVEAIPARESRVSPLERANDTTCVNVVDKDGNLFSATPSGAWLPALVAGDTGVLMGQRLQSAMLDANSPNVVAPGKRPRITLTPTLVLRGSEPFAVLSTPGGDNQDQALLQVFLNVVEFGMNPQEAVEAPRFDTQHLVSSFDDHAFLPGSLNVESRFADAAVKELERRGHRVKVQSAFGTLSAPTVILYDPRTGVISGGADPRRGRYALAW
ncbi:MAG TPA: gamma-glutamyltransferase family protein [Pyrinomonadaceae bacterium]|jgi:gamma-glutamyltranspeptidase/glutathione hydrolase|nr:gamma-glutamyltransferase family protein [Pyrinomonadaceae bacterium]